MQMIGEPLGLYFHIPFCKRKCDYCHFYVINDLEKAKNQLLEGLKLEIDLLQPFLKGKKIATIYFGGGTPSLFAPFRISQILEWIRNICIVLPDVEITLEVNPENATFELMQAYSKIGINRVSIGIQTLSDDLLSILGRLHSSQTARDAICTTYRAGIENISIDLMYDLPKQTLNHWVSTLDQLAELPLSHLSLYNLTIEPGTLFFKKQKELSPLLPDSESSLAMYEMAIQKLEKAGFKQYEISAFARPGAESRHNIGYWTGRPFLGLGPSAFSYWEEKRFRNVANLNRYCQSLMEGKSPIDFEEKLDSEAHRRELFVIQLRIRQGISLKTFSQQHGTLDQATLITMNRLEKEGYLNQFEGHITLTHRGLLFYDMVAAELI